MWHNATKVVGSKLYAANLVFLQAQPMRFARKFIVKLLPDHLGMESCYKLGQREQSAKRYVRVGVVSAPCFPEALVGRCTSS